MSSVGVYILLDDLEEKSGALSMREVLAHIGHQVGRHVASETNPSSLAFVVRPSPPALAAFGDLDDNDVDVLRSKSAQVQSRLRRLRYVSYKQVERDCEALAEQLSQRFGSGILSDGQFIGIPRGGVIVLGILSYVLDLNHDQIRRSAPPNGPVFVIDDCAITGSRVRRFLEPGTGGPNPAPDREVIFATLYAHPNLRFAIEEKSPHVTNCVSARDLHDQGPDELGDEYSAWQAQWHERHPDRRYWIGLTEHLCFPWGEVDSARWNSETEEIEQGFSLAPPEYCLENRHSTNRHLSSDFVQVQPDPRGPIRPSSAAFFGTVDDQMIVANPDNEICVELEGTAAAMWYALVEHGAIDDTVNALRQTYSVDGTALRTDLTGLAKQLAARNLLHVPDGSLA